MLRSTCAAILLGLAASPDLDVGVPPGSPLDFVRIPVASPRSARREIATQGTGAGRTVTQTALDRVPRQPIPLSRPLTLDFEGHLQWRPAEPSAAGTATGAGPLAGYPPLYPRDLYIHCASFFLMLMLHEDQVSPREVLCYLVEIGEPAAYAATAVRVEESLRAIADYVLAAAGGVPAWAPRPSKVKIDDDIARELVVAFPYEDRFGSEFLKLPGRLAVPSLTKLAESKGHPFLARNAAYALRLYDEEEALPTLRTLLKSQDKVLRNRALAALIRWQDREVVPWLVDQLDSQDVPFRSYVLYALGRIGDRRAVEPILKATRSMDWEILWGALAALARIREPNDEVSGFLARLPGLLNRMRLPDARRQILAERARIASACLGNKNEQAWIRGARVQEANRRLVEEWREFERQQMELASAPPVPPRAAAPPTTSAPAPPPPRPPPPTPSPAVLVLADARGRLMEYTGVRSLRAEGEAVVIEVGTEADAADLRLLLGAEIGPARLDVRIAR